MILIGFFFPLRNKLQIVFNGVGQHFSIVTCRCWIWEVSCIVYWMTTVVTNYLNSNSTKFSFSMSTESTSWLAKLYVASFFMVPPFHLICICFVFCDQLIDSEIFLIMIHYSTEFIEYVLRSTYNILQHITFLMLIAPILIYPTPDYNSIVQSIRSSYNHIFL